MIISLIIVFYVIAGCFVDALALILLTVPIFYPVVRQLYTGYDAPIWFGVIIVLVTQIGTITPPVGVCAYVVGGIERDVPLQTVFKGCMPFVVALIIVTALCVAFPQICTFCQPDRYSTGADVHRAGARHGRRKDDAVDGKEQPWTPCTR